MKNILVLIDNSINSHHLALSAMNVALKIEANITLAHAAKKNSTEEAQQEFGVENLNEREGLDAIAYEVDIAVKKTGSLIKIYCLMYNGSVIDLLAEKTNDGEVYLVIIGSHQSGEWEKVMFKTQMQDILENIGCPLLVIPKQFIVKDIHQTIFAVDLSIGYKKALRYVVAFSAPFGADVLVNHISKLGFPEKPSEEDLYNEVNLNLDPNLPSVAFHSIRSTNVKTALLETIEMGKVDLLCLVHKNYNFLSGLFHRSVSKQLADNASVPIMVLQESL
ncbi:universal stress protein [Pedobacter sp. SL55]|uniref:universal stress protein n=1 Tax=Pedobacter sp. SL55 TaxID=2995161 RepID=UPI00226DB767|nr:universal stress protein [Pedobacter sp. SL55]WAC39412.1 universal stress protein [Pedobacter sp. SL55]